MTAASGILVIDKPEGLSSAAVVARIKRLSRAAKVGHAGTLDPFASGVLVCCLNRATKLARFLLQGAKHYEALLQLGVETDTQDATGRETARRPLPPLSEAQIDQACDPFRGDFLQRPPIYSALKHQGRPLYDWARKGQPVEKPPRPVTISKLAVVAVALPLVRIEVHSSAGTYIRTLAADIGHALKCGAHLKALRRTRSAGFGIDQSVTLAQIEAMADDRSLDAAMVRPADALKKMPERVANQALAAHIAHGRPLSPSDTHDWPDGFVKIVDRRRGLLAVIEVDRQRSRYQYCCVLNGC